MHTRTHAHTTSANDKALLSKEKGEKIERKKKQTRECIPIFNFSWNVSLLTSVSSASLADAEDDVEEEELEELNARCSWILTGK